MKVKGCIYTDVGQSRRNNQDALLLKVANTKRYGRITMVAVCDGMGGLSKGEVASCKAVRALEGWFSEELPLLLGLSGNELWNAIEVSWKRLVTSINSELYRYGKHRGIKLGTTLTAFLQIGNRYLCMNIGDSRIYFVGNKEVKQITKDQSVCQNKIDMGLITEKEAESDQDSNVLMQCVGLKWPPEPEIHVGRIDVNTTVLACSDGFWRKLDTEEARQKICPQMCVTDEDMLLACRKLADGVMERGEDDNVSVAAACLIF